MGNLAITVRLNGLVVDDRVVPVRGAVIVGDDPRAPVVFPGAAFDVVRVGSALSVRGTCLEPGDGVTVPLGAVQVRLEHTLASTAARSSLLDIDGRFLVAAVLVASVGGWFDAAESWMDRQNELTGPSALVALRDEVRALQDPAGGQRTAIVSPQYDAPVTHASAPDIAEGPRHEGDDRLTGIGYASWYRAAIPEDGLASEAFIRVADDPSDTQARRVLARSAYESDDYERSIWHYGWLVDRYPNDATLKLRLAWAERRRGSHNREIELYRQVLEVDGGNVQALAGLAVALARVGRLDEAEVAVDELEAVAPMDPSVELTTALLEAARGRKSESLGALNRALAARGGLNEELRLELLRDVATDPLFAPLRRDRRLLLLMYRHFGAEAPRPAG